MTVKNGDVLDLTKILTKVTAGTPVVLEGSGTLADWRGEVRDGVNVLVLYAREPAQWRPANNGTGKYIWFLTKDDNSLPLSDQYYSKNGKLARFASYETAKRAADKLNAQAVQS